jgi:hypothetical protein
LSFTSYQYLKRRSPCKLKLLLLLGILLVQPAYAQQKGINANDAMALTTDEIVMKVSRVYCNMVTSGMNPEQAIQQAEGEVLGQVTRPPSFDYGIYRRLLATATNQKACPAAPKSLPLASYRSKCLTASDLLTFEQTGVLSTAHGSCSIQIRR